MKNLIFSGYSDDLIELDGDMSDEFTAASEGDVLYVANIVDGDGNGLRLSAIYDDNGCWSFAVGRLDEGTELPDWEIEMGASSTGYSTQVSINAPDDVVINRLK